MEVHIHDDSKQGQDWYSPRHDWHDVSDLVDVDPTDVHSAGFTMATDFVTVMIAEVCMVLSKQGYIKCSF